MSEFYNVQHKSLRSGSLSCSAGKFMVDTRGFLCATAPADTFQVEPASQRIVVDARQMAPFRKVPTAFEFRTSTWGAANAELWSKARDAKMKATRDKQDVLLAELKDELLAAKAEAHHATKERDAALAHKAGLVAAYETAQHEIVHLRGLLGSAGVDIPHEEPVVPTPAPEPPVPGSDATEEDVFSDSEPPVDDAAPPRKGRK